MTEDVPIPEEWDPAQFVWVQVADHIVARIEAGRFPPGSRLPPELDMAEEYGVARVTVRRAIEDLKERGLVRVLHGRGTFVLGPAEERGEN